MGGGEAVLRVLKLIISVYDLLTSWAYNIAANAGLKVVLQKVASELHPKVRNHGEGPY